MDFGIVQLRLIVKGVQMYFFNSYNTFIALLFLSLAKRIANNLPDLNGVL